VFHIHSNSYAKYSNRLATVAVPSAVSSIHGASFVSGFTNSFQYLWFQIFELVTKICGIHITRSTFAIGKDIMAS
jgi:hypothetical protein